MKRGTMANKFLTVVEDIGKGIAWPFIHLSRAINILQTTNKDYPQVRDAVVGLVTHVQTVATDFAAAAEADGLNVAADAAELAAALDLFKYCRDTFIPRIEAAYKDELAAATGAANTTTASTTAKASAQK
jgi:hypothetical protein